MLFSSSCSGKSFLHWVSIKYCISPVLHAQELFQIVCIPFIVGASPVVLLTQKLVKARVGDTLQINCSSTSLYDVEFKQIGQLHDLTIDEQIGWDLERDGNPRLSYIPEGCKNNEALVTIPCISILMLDVELSMHGRAFQCRATSKHQYPIIYYSEGMKLIGMLHYFDF